MPTISLSYQDYRDLIELVGRELSADELAEYLFLLKCEVEYSDLDSKEEFELYVEVTSDRPDMLSVEGLARALKGILEVEVGIPKYNVIDTEHVVHVEKSVNTIRPYIAIAIIDNVHLTDYTLRQLMQFQEKLHTTWCRNRRKASIGIYDLDKIDFPLVYKCEEPAKIRFIPLDKDSVMNAHEILAKTDQGVKYGHLIRDKPLYPLLLDANGVVLSMPPIVNSEDTKVTVDTRRLLIDVTGTDLKTVLSVLDILSTNIAERGFKIGRVRVENVNILTPVLRVEEIIADTIFINQVTGLPLKSEDIVTLLKKARFDAEVLEKMKIKVIVPPYRVDILHPVDIAEDVAIAYGFNRITPELPQVFTIGRELPISILIRHIRDIMTGLGFTEVLNYIMTNREILFKLSLIPEEPVVEVENPKSLAYVILRSTLIPGLLAFLHQNKHVAYPHKIFEVGDVVKVDYSAENRTRQYKMLGIAISDYSVGYEDIASVVLSLLSNIGLKEVKLREIRYPFLINGRAAEILVNNESLGYMGEVSPRVLVNFELENPVAVAELSISKILSLIKNVEG